MSVKDYLKLHLIKYDLKSELLLQKIDKAERKLEKIAKKKGEDPEPLTFSNIQELIPEYSKDEIEESVKVLKEMEYIATEYNEIFITEKGMKSLNCNLSVTIIWIAVILLFSIAAIAFFLCGSDLLYRIL